MKAPQIELRNIKVLEKNSEETACYSAELYVDGEHWGAVRNSGQGGPDDFDGHNGRDWDDINALDERIKKTMPAIKCASFDFTLEPDLELLCHEQVEKHRACQQVKRLCKTRLVFFKEPVVIGQPNKVWAINIRKGETVARLAALVKKEHPWAVILNELPLEKAGAIYFEAAA